MEGFWPIFFLAVVLKIPVVFAIWLVLWAMKQYDATEDAPGGGPPFTGPRRPRSPMSPRRGPHARRRALPSAAGRRRQPSRGAPAHRKVSAERYGPRRR